MSRTGANEAGEWLDELPGVPAGMGVPISDPLPEGHQLDDGDGGGWDGPGPTTSSDRKDGKGGKGWRPPRLDAEVVRGMTEVATATVEALGGLLNHTAARDEDDEIWLPLEEETEAMAAPLGRIAARHMPPVPDGVDAGDLADALVLIVSAGFYALRNLNEAVRRRRDRRRVLAGTVERKVEGKEAAA